MNKTVYIIEDFIEESDSWEPIAVALTRDKAEEFCKAKPEYKHKNLFIEEVDFYE